MPTTLYASTNEGLFRSEDEGQSWEAIDLPVEGVNIISLAVDANNDIVYAGTDEVGLFFSEDKGQTWTQSASQFNGLIRALAVDPQTDNVYAGVGGFGIYLSTNRGQDWTLTGRLPDDYRIATMALDSATNALYLGAENRVLRTFDNGQTWQDITSNLPDAPITGLHLDLQNKLLFVSSFEGVYRSTDGGSTWQQSLSGFLALSLLSVPGLGLFVGVGGNGGVYRTEDNGENWSLAGEGVSEVVVTSLMFDPETTQLYAGTNQRVDSLFRGVFEDTTIVWSSVGQAFSQRAVFALAAAPEPPPLPEEVEILSGGLYWKERFPVERGRINASREALQTLRGEHDRQQDGMLYPWRLGFLPATQLPALLRFWLQDPLVDDQDRSPSILHMLPLPSQTQAIFGIREDARDNFENELQPGPVTRMEGQTNGRETQIRHYSYQQIYKNLQVVGGSVRIHGILGDRRVAVTSSYFPIPADYQFVSDPTPEEESGEAQLTPRLSPQETEQKAVQAVIQTGGIYDKQGAIANAIEQALAAGDSQALTKALVQADQFLEVGLGKLLIPWAVWMLQQGAPLQWLGMRLTQFILLITGLRAQTITAKIVNIGGRDLGIMALAAAYHLISRVRVQMANDDPWYVNVDRKSGQIVGSPWQTIAGSDRYYRDSGEAMPEQSPGGDQLNSTDLDGLNTYLAEISTPTATISGPSMPAQIVNDPSIKVSNVAVHAKRVHDHLVNQCGVPANKLTGYSLDNNSSQSPGLAVEVDSNKSTAFDYDDEINPKVIRFELDTGSGLEVSNEDNVPGVGNNYMVYTPALDPEVIMHEFTHAFLWLLNPEPWVTPPMLRPFGRALQEGYATYLARSIAAQDTTDVDEQQKVWARAAYPERKHAVGNPPNWEERWKPGRTQKVWGADLLPLPNTYPAGHYDSDSLLNYDVGMVWTRALWDLRELVGWQRADYLAVQACPYLHGYIANFELATEAILDVDIKEADNVNLENGSQPIWAMRGIAAGQGIHGFAQAQNGTLIAASDAGILKYAANKWDLEENNFDNAGVFDTLTGVVAVARGQVNKNILYAAVQLPPPTGSNTQWQPNIYSKNTEPSPDNPNPIWEPVGNWATDTGDATPLSLLVLNNDTVLVGTSLGVYRFSGGPWRQVGDLTYPPSDNFDPDLVKKNGFAALGLTVAPDDDGDLRIRAFTPNSLRQIRLDDLLANPPGNWSYPSSSTLFGQESTRPTAIVAWGDNVNDNVTDNVYVGTWANGLQKIRPNTLRSDPYSTTNGATLAMTAKNPTLYIATENDVSQKTSSTAFNSLSLPHPSAQVISLFVTETDHLLAGTLAHGIWRYNDSDWQLEYTAPSPTRITLANNEMGLLSFARPAAYQLHYATSAGVTLVQVIKPGFPPESVNPTPTTGSSTMYNLEAGSVILVLDNSTSDPITLGIRVDQVSGNVNIDRLVLG